LFVTIVEDFTVLFGHSLFYRSITFVSCLHQTSSR
jgi:hypothetical protein